MELAQNNKTKWKGKHAVLAGSRSREEKNEGDAEFGEKAAYNGHYMLGGGRGNDKHFFQRCFPTNWTILKIQLQSLKMKHIVVSISRIRKPRGTFWKRSERIKDASQYGYKSAMSWGRESVGWKTSKRFLRCRRTWLKYMHTSKKNPKLHVHS